MYDLSFLMDIKKSIDVFTVFGKSYEIMLLAFVVL